MLAFDSILRLSEVKAEHPALTTAWETVAAEHVARMPDSNYKEMMSRNLDVMLWVLGAIASNKAVVRCPLTGASARCVASMVVQDPARQAIAALVFAAPVPFYIMIGGNYGRITVVSYFNVGDAPGLDDHWHVINPYQHNDRQYYGRDLIAPVVAKVDALWRKHFEDEGVDDLPTAPVAPLFASISSFGHHAWNELSAFLLARRFGVTVSAVVTDKYDFFGSLDKGITSPDAAIHTLEYDVPMRVATVALRSMIMTQECKDFIALQHVAPVQLRRIYIDFRCPDRDGSYWCTNQVDVYATLIRAFVTKYSDAHFVFGGFAVTHNGLFPDILDGTLRVANECSKRFPPHVVTSIVGKPVMACLQAISACEFCVMHSESGTTIPSWIFDKPLVHHDNGFATHIYTQNDPLFIDNFKVKPSYPKEHVAVLDKSVRVSPYAVSDPAHFAAWVMSHYSKAVA